MFPRLIIIVVIIVAVLALLRHLRARLGSRSTPAIDAKTVRCAHCEVYFPRTDAVRRGEHYFCSAEHADAAGR